VPEERTPQLVVQGADFELTYQKLKIACLAIRAGASFIATNLDRSFPSEEGLIPGAGALVAALQTATDVEPLAIGKPQPVMFEVAMQMLGCSADTTLVIGDRLDTDIAGARNAGMPAALVLTGVSEREAAASSPHAPDAVFDDLVQLLEHWQTALAGER
jgi:4-nitrophenyl phosphatase